MGIEYKNIDCAFRVSIVSIFGRSVYVKVMPNNWFAIRNQTQWFVDNLCHVQYIVENIITGKYKNNQLIVN